MTNYAGESMNWPTAPDYNEAVQSPGFCFSDPELRGGRSALDRFGIPTPISGNFASVYQIACGQSIWAVRCFTREFGDGLQRY